MAYSSTKSGMSAQTKQALHNFKMETAREVGVSLNDGYNGELTSKQAGSIGGQMVKKLIQQAENNLK
ncbi:MAG: alpha/beta-type small acid-soluble spore protein [Clostridia bacterium]|nr:alpha/beta-type small acid-soluble spore protein [Clostridia bacterium]